MKPREIFTEGRRYQVNVEPSPEDLRDFRYASHLPPIVSLEHLPEDLNHTPQMPPVRDQGRQGSCVAQALSSMKEWHERRDIGFQGHMSPQFLYDSRPNRSAGMFPRESFKFLQRFGCCSEKIYPYRQKETKDVYPEGSIQIPRNAYKEALNHKINYYVRLDNILQTKDALVKEGPCLIAVPVYANYNSESGLYEVNSPTFWKKEPDSIRVGGHAMSIVGYNSKKQAFLIFTTDEIWKP